jgi:hypothetical protein
MAKHSPEGFSRHDAVPTGLIASVVPGVKSADAWSVRRALFAWFAASASLWTGIGVLVGQI